jgi:uncharacterized protein
VSPPVSDFLDSLRDWAAHQPTIAGVALVGSYARGEARPDSDIDVVLLCEEPHAFVAHTSWIHSFGAVERCLTEDWGRMFQRCWSAILSGCMRHRATPKLRE